MATVEAERETTTAGHDAIKWKARGEKNREKRRGKKGAHSGIRRYMPPKYYRYCRVN
jgi:hypothetical protein